MNDLVEYGAFKNFDDLNIQDNFMFQQIMLEKAICINTLRLATNYNVKDISYPDEEKTLKATINGKGIRLDVYVEDEQGKKYDLEMQLTMGSEGELPRRSRYYLGNIDIDNIKRGENYRKLPVTVVIFICTFDYFKRGLPVYTFPRICKEDNSIEFGDGSSVVFLNTKYDKGKLVQKGLAAFLDYVDCQLVSDDFTRSLDERTKKIKIDDETRRMYMTYQATLEDVAYQAEERGKQKGRIENIIHNIHRLMETLKMTADEAMNVLGVSDSDRKIVISML